MKNTILDFLKDDSGAVTVDWIVITAAVVGLSAISFFTLEDAAFSLMDSAGSAIDQEDDFE